MKSLLVFIVLLLLAPSQVLADTATLEAADGWFSWHIVGGEAAGKKLYVRKSQGNITRVAMSGEYCGFTRREPATDLGELSTDDAVSMLLELVMNEELERDIRQQALFGLAQSGSERAFATLDDLILGS